MDKISIRGLEVFANHGVFKEENVLGQKFIVNAELVCDTRSAGKEDNLEKSVNYAEVCNLITKVMRNNTFKLIEAAAEMYLRGLKFLPIDLNKSSASEFLMEDGALRPPFNCIPALGNTVAKEIVEARREHPFTSKEDLKKRGKVSQSIIDTMDEMGILHGLSLIHI